MHRHLLGLNSPPNDYVADRFASTMFVPEHWDGDAWIRANGREYFLRAWNVMTGRVAYGRGTSFEQARLQLLIDVTEGTRHVQITTYESLPT